MNLIITLPESDQIHLSIAFDNNVISAIDYCHNELQQSYHQSELDNNEFAQKIRTEFDHYFHGRRHLFSLPCQLTLGTTFQQKVWQALLRIPAGRVTTYGALAKELNSSARAVGNACRNNRFPVIVPCHRVVSASGIGGYAGDTLKQQKGDINFLQIKQWLLAHEKANLE